MNDQPIHVKPPELMTRYRCERCQGRRRIWDHERGDFKPCPECSEPEPARRAA